MIILVIGCVIVAIATFISLYEIIQNELQRRRIYQQQTDYVDDNWDKLLSNDSPIIPMDEDDAEFDEWLNGDEEID